MEELETGMSNAEFVRWVALADLDQLRAQTEKLKAGRGGRRAR